jgi:hypothetical protein
MTAPKVNWSEKDQFYWLRGAFDEVLTFDSVLDAQAAARQIEIDNAVKAKVEAIAAWMLTLETRDGIIEELADTLAEGIKRGDYK